MSRKAQLVVPRGDKWRVRTAGASRASGIFDTQSEAIEKARDLARSQGAELYIYDRSGRISERSSYEKAPFPPKG